MSRVLEKGRKHCGKKRNCSLRAIFPFLTVFFKRPVLQIHEKQGLAWERVKRRKHCGRLDPQ